MIYTYGAQTSAGRVRANNEDAYSLDARGGLAVLADGMGGYQAGEVASHMATTLIKNAMSQWLSQAGDFPETTNVRQALTHCVAQANLDIFTRGLTQPECRGMGTTVVAAVFGPDTLVLVHVGDSRCYRLRHGKLKQLTKDHSVLQEEIDAGLVTPEQALLSTHKNLVTRALGVAPDVMMDVLDEPIQSGDLYLLCSDGLTDMVRDAQLSLALEGTLDPQEKADLLVQTANNQGGRDNISVVVVQAG